MLAKMAHLKNSNLLKLLDFGFQFNLKENFYSFSAFYIVPYHKNQSLRNFKKNNDKGNEFWLKFAFKLI